MGSPGRLHWIAKFVHGCGLPQSLWEGRSTFAQIRNGGGRKGLGKPLSPPASSLLLLAQSEKPIKGRALRSSLLAEDAGDARLDSIENSVVVL